MALTAARSCVIWCHLSVFDLDVLVLLCVVQVIALVLMFIVTVVVMSVATISLPGM